MRLLCPGHRAHEGLRGCCLLPVPRMSHWCPQINAGPQGTCLSPNNLMDFDFTSGTLKPRAVARDLLRSLLLV